LSLVLNSSAVQFDDRKISVGRLPYGEDGQQVLAQLREEHNGTHIFRRDGPDAILAVSVVQDVPSLGEPETIRLKEHLSFTAALIRNALLTYLAEQRSVLIYEPMKFIGSDDFLRAGLPEGCVPPDWLALRLLCEVAIRPIYFFGSSEKFVG
jgi:hypothetical protein